MILNRCYIKNYKNYKLVIDDKIKNACNEALFFPYNEVVMTKAGILNLLKSDVSMSEFKKIKNHFKFNLDIDCLRTICAKISISASFIKSFVKTFKIKPDIVCLGNVIENGTLGIIKFIYSEMDVIGYTNDNDNDNDNSDDSSKNNDNSDDSSNDNDSDNDEELIKYKIFNNYDGSDSDV
jgi:hypothetical protein